MSQINVNLRGDVKPFEKGISAAEIAKSIGMGLYKAACACKIDGKTAAFALPWKGTVPWNF